MKVVAASGLSRARTDFGDQSEADLSTQQAGAQAPSWLSRPLGDGRRPQGARGAAGARAQETLRLIGRPRPGRSLIVLSALRPPRKGASTPCARTESRSPAPSSPAA